MSWIKMRVGLEYDPAVIAMADRLNLPDYAIVGLLHKVWSWATENLTDGNAASVTKTFIDRYTSVTGFADAMQNVGWLEVLEGGGIVFAKWDRHLSKGAKSRFLTQERVKKTREVCNDSVTLGALQKRYQRREEKIRDLNPPKSPPAGGDLQTEKVSDGRPRRKTADERRREAKLAGEFATHVEIPTLHFDTRTGPVDGSPPV